MGHTERLVLVTSFVVALTAAGCAPKPSDRCLDYEMNVQAYFERCGSPLTFHVVDPRTGEPACSRVRRVVNLEEVTGACYTWLRTVDCANIDPAAPLDMFPPECSGDHFQITE